MSKDKKQRSDPFEVFLRDLSLSFDPKKFSITLSFPSLPFTMKGSTDNDQYPISHTISLSNEKYSLAKSLDEDLNNHDRNLTSQDQNEYTGMNLDDLDTESEPVRVKIHLKAYIRMALHSLKYSNFKLNKKNWIEVIGLLTGYIENKDTPLSCMVVTDAFPIGHGTDVTAQIQDPQSMVRVYKNASKSGQVILGWYHSHPGYSPFMSNTDYRTQVRYQRLGSEGLSAPFALVIDPTEISAQSYGFKIFRLKEDMKSWEHPRYEVLNCPLETLPGMMNALLPVAINGAMFLEYDHEKVKDW